MIRFLRQIRLNSLFESKMGRYMVYGLGEILLVVIGILIALQVNNWNEQRKNRTYEITLLGEAKEAMASDIKILSQRLSYLTRVQKVIRTLSIMKNDRSYPTDSLSYYLNRVHDYGTTLTVNTSAYEAIKSGGLDRITNTQIRNNLSELYGHTLGDSESWINEVFRRELFKRTDLFYKVFGFKVTPDDGNDIIIQAWNEDPALIYDNPEFDHLLATSGWPLRGTISRMSSLIEQMMELIKLIDEEIKS